MLRAVKLAALTSRARRQASSGSNNQRQTAPLVEVMARQLRICFINPKFEPSYWGFEYALPLYPGNKRASMIAGALPHLAGLSAGHEVRLVDENVEDIPWSEIPSFDIVGVTGMNVQKERMRQILQQLRPMGVLTVVGGAYASVDESFFDGLCDVVFSGEADETWPEFLRCIAEGRNHGTLYKQRTPTDMSRVPKPRFDLLKVNRYASGALQFSRGCPFQCEFCDIIVTFGRRPRTKPPAQVLEELEEMRRVGFFSCFIVDDNFIGNKRAAKELLRLIVPWQEQHNYPLRLTTEASINLADDPELLDLLYEANFRSVFIGIESPSPASLNETKKFQNTRGDSLEAKLARIRNAGIEVSAGFIVGFDNDDPAIFEDQFRFIQENGIPLAMVGMLTAVPKTPLYERLQKEGRLRLDDANCNIVPKRMTHAQLQENYWALLKRLYDPEAFLDRCFKINEYPEFKRRRAAISKRANEGKTWPTLAFGLLLLCRLMVALLRERSLSSVGAVYLRNFFRRSLRVRSDVIGFAQFMNRCVTHWHFYKFTREATAGRLRLFNSG
jgi:radical SAM superfamily enzyme YgiQ (UPF0313 family)